MLALAAVLSAAGLAWLVLASEAPRGIAAGPSRPVAATPTAGSGPRSEPTASTEGRSSALAPADPSTALEEPSGTDLALLQVELPLGTLEVLVLEGREPLAGVRVLAHGLLGGGAPEQLELRDGHGLEAVTGNDGLVRFQGVAPDSYSVRALAPGRAPLETSAIHTRNRSRRVLLVFGGAQVHGTVYDRSGAPVPACRVSVGAHRSPIDDQWTEAFGETDAAGRYEIAGLVSADVIWVSRSCGGEKESVSTRLGPGEERQVDFGVLGGAPRWTGTVRDVSGAPVELAGDIATLRLEDRRRDRFGFDERGHFEVELAPGNYTLTSSGFGGSIVIGEVSVPPEGLAQDVTLPGTRLEVELVYAGTDPAGRSLDRVAVFLADDPEVQGHRAELGTGGLRGFRCVPPGRYWLRTSPLRPLGNDPAPVVVRAGEPLQRIELSLTE